MKSVMIFGTDSFIGSYVTYNLL